MPCKLRVAVSVFFGVLSVALCVLWVRSYYTQDYYCRQGWGNFVLKVASRSGRIAATVYRSQPHTVYHSNRAYYRSGVINNEYDRHSIDHSSWQRLVTKLGFDVEVVHWPKTRDGWLACPYWVVAAVSIAATASPWIPCRFSLRTLLIATTLIAIVLGLGVWLAR